MKKLTNQQTDFIINKINSNPNLSSTLKDDLVDHFCCVIEGEMNKGKDFDTAYQIAYNRISPDGIDELGKEMMFLMGSKSKKRLSNLLRISGFSAMTCLFITVIMKAFYLSYAQLVLLLTVSITLFLFLPSLFTYLVKNNTKKNKWMYIIGFLGLSLLIISILFFVSHWSGSRTILAIAILLVYIAIFPLFFYKIHRKNVV